VQNVVAFAGAVFLYVARRADEERQRQFDLQERGSFAGLAKLLGAGKGLEKLRAVRAVAKRRVRQPRRRHGDDTRRDELRLVVHGVQALNGAQAMADEADARAGVVLEPVVPRFKIRAAVVDDLVSAALPTAAGARDGHGDPVMSAGV